jgi:signal peptidase I
MNTFQRSRQSIFSGLLLVLLIATWTALAPSQVGGQAAYVIVDGTSMEPGFHLGDLAIVRATPVYGPGDIVAYRNQAIKRYVFHRIIAVDGGHFILQGDNNDWTDSYQPVQAELVGKLWVHIPGAGAWLQWLRRPANTGVLAAILGTLLAAGMLGRRRDGLKMNNRSFEEWFRRIRENGFRGALERLRSIRLFQPGGQAQGLEIIPPAGPARPQGLKHLAGVFETAFFALAVIIFASLAIGYFAFTRPTLQAVPDNLEYQHVGRFFYSAEAPAGIYDTGSVRSGDPLFPKLTCTMNMGFSYALAGIQASNLSGTYRLVATISDEQSGWRHTIPLLPQTTFKGNSFVASAPIDLCKIESIVAEMEATTDLHSSYYSLDISPIVAWTGEAAGQKIEGSFAPQLKFQFNRVLFFVVRPDPQIDPFTPAEQGTVNHSRIAANVIPILGMKLDVPRARLLSSLGLIASLAGLAFLGAYTASLARRSQETFAQIKYGPLLVDARDRSLETTSRVIDIGSIDDLAKLAERNNTVILYQKQNLIHFYSVQADKLTYRYAISQRSNSLAATPLMQLEDDLQRGLEQGEFVVHYQPIMSLADGRVFGVEALLRWQHPQRGLVPAAEFIPAAEATGLINPIGEWLLRIACAQIRDWREDGHPLTLSINLSERQLEGDPAGSILRVLQNTGMDPHTLQIEIPDTRMFERSQTIIPKLQDLKDRGVGISMDDSSGYSILSAFPSFPISSIKIDRPFVQRISERGEAGNIQRMIESARGQGLNVTAVGVETQEQLEFLQAKYCNFAQGYLLGRPASAQEITRSLLQAAEPGGQGPTEN